MHKILQQLLNRTFTYYHQISCKTEGDIKRKLLYLFTVSPGSYTLRLMTATFQRDTQAFLSSNDADDTDNWQEGLWLMLILSISEQPGMFKVVVASVMMNFVQPA